MTQKHNTSRGYCGGGVFLLDSKVVSSLSDGQGGRTLHEQGSKATAKTLDQKYSSAGNPVSACAVVWIRWEACAFGGTNSKGRGPAWNGRDSRIFGLGIHLYIPNPAATWRFRHAIAKAYGAKRRRSRCSAPYHNTSIGSFCSHILTVFNQGIILFAGNKRGPPKK